MMRKGGCEEVFKVGESQQLLLAIQLCLKSPAVQHTAVPGAWYAILVGPVQLLRLLAHSLH
jgi:hypothetical protein